MLNEKEINYFKSILQRDNYKLEDNIKFFKSKGIKLDETYKEEYEKQENTLNENKETIKKLEQMLNSIISAKVEKTEKNDFRTEEFYLSLKIPKQIIELELNSVGEFSGFPFFLRREGANLEVILMHQYPKGIHSFVKLPPKSCVADGAKEIFITIEKIEELLKQGFKWFHESQYDTLW